MYIHTHIYADLLKCMYRSGKTMADVKKVCERKWGPNSCWNNTYVKSIMQEYYPDVEVWTCDTKTGVATQLV